MDRRAALLALALVGLSLAALPTGAAGPTYVSGEVTGTWTPEGSPYVLIGNASVPAAGVLEVHAGVQVLGNRGLHLGVGGTLRVLGTPDAPVRFGANGTAAAPGFWRGLVAVQGSEVSLAHAIVESAATGLWATGGAPVVVGSSFTQGITGLLLDGATATVTESSFSHNAENGVLVRNGALALRSSLVQGNRVGLNLVGAQVLAENGTFLGPAAVDASLDLGSYLRLRVGGHGASVKLVDVGSRVDLEGLLAVSVTDAFGVPVAGAEVLVEDNANGTASLRATTDREGSARFLLTARTILKTGDVDFNPFTVTASLADARASVGVRVAGAADVSVAIPVDRVAPTPVSARLVVGNEDAPIRFDATGSTDNDPDLLATGTFRWTFPELAVELLGATASHVFDTPGLYQGALTVSDQSGNEGVLTFAVRVRDVTPPQIVSVLAADRGLVGERLTFETLAADNDPAFASGASYLWRFTLDADVVEAFGPTVTVSFDRPGTWRARLTVTDGDGNAATEERTVAIAAPPQPPSPLPWIGGGGALFAAALALATERGKLGLLGLLLPLYTRIKDDEVLDQFTRGQIFGYIRVHPGDTYTDIKRNLELNNGTLTYHLDVLERQGLVRAVNRGSRKLFYPVDVRPAEDGGGLHELQQRMLRVLGEAPGAGVGDLAAVLGVSRQLALYHLRLLSQEGRVRLERKGLKLRGFAVERQE